MERPLAYDLIALVFNEGDIGGKSRVVLTLGRVSANQINDELLQNTPRTRVLETEG